MAIYKLSCHCNSVEIELNLKKELEEITRCNCSLCKRRGSIMAAIKLNDLKIIKGKDKLTKYKFGRKQHAEHFFCSICGIYTHHIMRSNPKMAGINVACLEGINPFELGDIPVNDGINHPLDQKK